MERLNENYKDVMQPDCLCGPNAMEDLFTACFQDGTVTNNPPGPDGRYYVVCTRCGRIIDSESLIVVGSRDVNNIENEIDDLE